MSEFCVPRDTPTSNLSNLAYWESKNHNPNFNPKPYPKDVNTRIYGQRSTLPKRHGTTCWFIWIPDVTPT